jgi:uncharacterized protein YprB with RNaseH-like and TPR domain
MSLETPTNRKSGDNLSSPTIPFLDKWLSLSAKPFKFEDEHIFIREVDYPLEHQHGLYQFNELAAVVEEWNRSKSNHPLSARDRSAEDLLFFDTETTGLSHGVGNTIFLLGCCRIYDGKIQVKQFFLPAPESEVAFYQAFLQDTNNLKKLVTYNGKAFDWPQVKTRHTLIRDAVPKLPAFGHYDLLHGSRRLWKKSLESCKLSMIEENILGVTRQDDIPGYLAPMLYFDFLREKDPEIIEGILLHNEKDMLSLVTLYIHISHMLLCKPTDKWSSTELYELGRWYEHVGEDDTALSYYTQALDGGGEDQYRTKMTLATLLKKRGEWERAVELWRSLEDQSAISQSALCVELAKIYEHRYKDYELALHYALKAYDAWKQEIRLLRKKMGRDNEQYIKRIERLEGKCGGKEGDK